MIRQLECFSIEFTDKGFFSVDESNDFVNTGNWIIVE